MSARARAGLFLLVATSTALAAPDAPAPGWPVPNPTLGRAGFTPSSDDRQVIAPFGPRLKWGDDRYDHHEGWDFHAFFDREKHPDGHHPVVAVLPGVVTQVIDPPDPERVETGRKVVVTHDVPWSRYGAPEAWGPVKTGYLHLTSIAVREGQRLEQGETVGVAGESGHTTLVHLHLNVYRAGPRGRDVNVNPARLFSPRRFPETVAPLEPSGVDARVLEREADRLVVRVVLPFNAYTLDGFALDVDGDRSRTLSFEQVTAERHDVRDRGDQDLVPGLRVYPLRFNGGGALDRVNREADLPPEWPARRFPPEAGLGPRRAFDLVATGVPARVRRVTLHVVRVEGPPVVVRLPAR